MAKAMINPQMISWARERAGLSLVELAAKLKQSEERLEHWESGQEQPTFKQAQDIAHKTYQPFGFLFLAHPPQEDIPLPDLRTVGDTPIPRFSVNLRDTIQAVVSRLDWYREYLKEQGAEPLEFIGSVSIDRDTPQQAAQWIKARLGLAEWPSRGTYEDYLRDLVERAESLGILVMRNSRVGQNSHRPLDIKEFRGFAIADEYAPTVFINTQDTRQACLFTLIHELSHIWLGKSGISDLNPSNSRTIERFCNSVAAEFLAPAKEFLKLWNDFADESWHGRIPTLVSHFHVSHWVIARRALELALISEEQYWPYVEEIQEAYKRHKRNNGGPVSQDLLMKHRVSSRFAQAVCSETLSGRVLYRDAQQLTGVKPDRLRKFANKELQS